MYVPKVLIGSIETFISTGLVLLFSNEPIHRAFLLFSFKPEISSNFPNNPNLNIIINYGDPIPNVWAKMEEFYSVLDKGPFQRIKGFFKVFEEQ